MPVVTTKLPYTSTFQTTITTIIIIICILLCAPLTSAAKIASVISPGSSLIQIGSYNIASDISAFNSGSYVQRYYTIAFANSHGVGYARAATIQNLKFSFSAVGTKSQIAVLDDSTTSSSMTIKVGSNPGNRLYQLQMNFIVIQPSLFNCLYIQANSYYVGGGTSNGFSRNLTFSHGYLGGSNTSPTTTMIFLAQYRCEMTAYGGNIDLTVINVNSTSYLMNIYVWYQTTFLSGIDFNVLFYNKATLYSNSIVLALGPTVGPGPYNPATSAGTMNIFTDTSVCLMYSNNTLLGFQSFRAANQLWFTLNRIGTTTIQLVSSYSYLELKFNVFEVSTLMHTCDNPTYPYYCLVDDFCYDVCPGGTFLNVSSSECGTCPALTYFFNDSCQSTCPPTTYINIASGRCLYCSDPCLNCDLTSTSCTSCVNGTFFLNNVCYYFCPDFYFQDPNTGTCLSCSSNCLNCSSLVQCYQCASGSFLYNSACVLMCPNTTYGDTTVNQCLNCTGTCVNCEQSAQNCTSCVVDTFFFNNSCYYVCPLGYYGNNSTLLCETCDTNCLNCTSLLECYQCQDGSFLYQGLCLLTCPNTTFSNPTTNTCDECLQPCQTCTNLSTNCTSCINSTYLYNFNCLSVCPTGLYGNSSTGSCEYCLLNCQSCTEANVCTKCASPNYLYPTLDGCFSYCQPNYFPNKTSSACQQIYILGCNSALYRNGMSICLQCNISTHFKFDPITKLCVCQSGYRSSHGQCIQVCGDGIIVSGQQCDDGNYVNGDGCSSSCVIQKDFNCKSIIKANILTSSCVYLPQIKFQVLSQTKVDGENSLKIILNVNPAPLSFSALQIKKFLHLSIGNQTINISNIQITYQNGIAQIYIPYSQTIEGEELKMWTNFDSSKFASQNIEMSSILKGDNSALIFSNNWKMYKNISTFNYSLSILVCVAVILSFYKHKMIGLELIIPFQVIFYSQSFYKTSSVSDSLYAAFKPVSFSVFTPHESESKSNSLYRIGMTGGFLQNYNFLGLLFVISTILLIVSMFKAQLGQTNRFKNKKTLREWTKFGQFRVLIEKYETVIWKGFFVFFCLSTIPLIFAVTSKAMTQTNNYESSNVFDILSQKLSFWFVLLFLFGLFYTSIPQIFYNNKKNFLKRHIFAHDCQKFNYNASYCIYFELHYLAIGCVLAFASPTLPVLYALSAINGVFFLYLLIVRPYESKIDNLGAILSNSICCYFFSINLYFAIANNSDLSQLLKSLSFFVIIGLLLIQCIVALIRYIIFYRMNLALQENGYKQSEQRKFKYVKDEAYNKLTKQTKQEQKQEEINKLMKQIKPVVQHLFPMTGISIQNSNDAIRNNCFRQNQANIFQSQQRQIEAFPFNPSQNQKEQLKKRLRKSLLQSRVNQSQGKIKR